MDTASSNDLFSGSSSFLERVDFEYPIRLSERKCCTFYGKPYADAARSVADSGNFELAGTYRFLATLVGFQESFDTPMTPFGPLIQWEGKRSPVPGDLTDSDRQALRVIASRAKDSALRARLFDLIWELDRDHLACREAASSYLCAAQYLNESGDWVLGIPLYKRALDLAARLGRDKELYQDVANQVRDVAKGSVDHSDDFKCCFLLEVVQQYRLSADVNFAEIAERIARDAESAGAFRKSRHYWEVASGLWSNCRDEEKSGSARLCAAETYIDEAKERLHDEGKSALAASNFLIQGIEALRRAGGQPERIAELRKMLRGVQRDALSEMTRHSVEVNISEAVRSARQLVMCDSLEQSLCRFAFGLPLINLEELRMSVEKNAKEFPMSHMFNGAMMDSDGRVIQQRSSLLGLVGQALEDRIEEEMFSHAAQYNWPMRVSSFIEPARVQILNEYHPSLDELVYLVRNNPFVPPGHEAIFLRGLHQGFHGDFLLSAHLLVPQIENSLRFVLESNDVDTSNLQTDGTQPVKVLGGLFSMDELKAVFGDEMCFELRGCLIEKSGYDFRNRLAHGFVTEADCYMNEARLLWWLVLRLCLMPIYSSHVSESRNANSADEKSVDLSESGET